MQCSCFLSVYSIKVSYISRALYFHRVYKNMAEKTVHMKNQISHFAGVTGPHILLKINYH